MAMTTAAGPPIICPVTGRTWPNGYQIALKLCSACGGWIDIRHEAWRDGPFHAPACPTRPGAAAPVAEAAALAPRVKAETTDPRPRDEVHDAVMREIQIAERAAT